MLIRKPPPFLVKVSRIILYFFFNAFKFFSYRFVLPKGEASKVFILNKHGQILLTKIGYSHKSWVLPGGSVDRGETAEAAAVRELEEEAGVKVNQVDFMFTNSHEKYDRVNLHYYFGQVDEADITIDTLEITDGGWFELDQLPIPRRPKLELEVNLLKDWLTKNKEFIKESA